MYSSKRKEMSRRFPWEGDSLEEWTVFEAWIKMGKKDRKSKSSQDEVGWTNANLCTRNEGFCMTRVEGVWTERLWWAGSVCWFRLRSVLDATLRRNFSITLCIKGSFRNLWAGRWYDQNVSYCWHKVVRTFFSMVQDRNNHKIFLGSKNTADFTL